MKTDNRTRPSDLVYSNSKRVEVLDADTFEPIDTFATLSLFARHFGIEATDASRYVTSNPRRSKINGMCAQYEGDDYWVKHPKFQEKETPKKEVVYKEIKEPTPKKTFRDIYPIMEGDSVKKESEPKKEFRNFEPVQINEECRTVNEEATDSIMKRLDFLSGSQYHEIQGLLKDILSEEIVLFREKIRESLYGFDSHKGIRDVIDYVTERYLVSFNEIQSKSRKRNIAEPRQIIHWMLRSHVVFNRLSLRCVGELVGSRDHATVLHSVKEVNNWIATDRTFRERLMVMCNELGAKTMWIPEKKELLVTGYYKRKQNETVSTEKTEQKEHATA